MGFCVDLLENSLPFIKDLVKAVQCLKCSKLFINPETNECGHSLCKQCWRAASIGTNNLKLCVVCNQKVVKLKANHQLSLRVVHIQKLVTILKKDFNLDVAVVDNKTPKEVQPVVKINRVEDWLISSQNHFSAPSDSQINDSLHKIANHIDIERSKKDNKIGTNDNDFQKSVMNVCQNDWDKIEVMEDSEKILQKDNIIGPMDIETFVYHTEDYTVEHPRRSSRGKKEHETKSLLKNKINNKRKHNEMTVEAIVELNKIDSEEIGIDNVDQATSEKSSLKPSWKNVKKMKKEFSKLKKRDVKKLNVSIEMCKRSETLYPKNNDFVELVKTPYVIEDDLTPTIDKDQIALEEVKMKSNNKPLRDCKKIGKDKIALDAIKIKSNKIPLQECNILLYDTLTKSDVIKPTYLKQTGEHIGEVCVEKNMKNSEIMSCIETKQLNISDSQKEKKIEEVIHTLSIANKEINDLPEVNLKSTQCVNKDDAESSKVTEPLIANAQKMQDNIKNQFSQSLIQNQLMNSKQTNNKTSNSRNVIPFLVKGKLVNKSLCAERKVPFYHKERQKGTPKNNDEIQITIKSGSISTSITVSNKGGRLKVSEMKVDNAMQTNLDEIPSILSHAKPKESSKIPIPLQSTTLKAISTDKASTNKNTQTTSSAYRITDSEAQELSKAMDCNDDIDIFNSGSVVNGTAASPKKTTSEIIICTTKSKKAKNLNNDLKVRNKNDEQTLDKEISNAEGINDSEHVNYAEFMGQVFADIEADMEDLKQSQKSIKIKDSQKIDINTLTNRTINPKFGIDNKYSENVFTAYDKLTQNSVRDMETEARIDSTTAYGTNTQENVANLLTPRMCQNFVEVDEKDVIYGSKPHLQCNKDIESDSSIVEETPQKTKTSIQSTKLTSKEQNQSKINQNSTAKKHLISQEIRNIINMSSSTTQVTEKESQNFMDIVNNIITEAKSLETPLTIKSFSHGIVGKSTPIARKSLNFSKTNVDKDISECTEVNITTPGKNTIDKINMENAFEKKRSNTSIINSSENKVTPQKNIDNKSESLDKHQKPLRKLSIRSNSSRISSNQICVACSCLQPMQVLNVKILCKSKNWIYSDKFVAELTHLIVGVDENNISQRSVKYMCALAASKWILSYEWIVNCQRENKAVDETPFEVLDNTGARGPYLSRIATTKLFTGISFYCMPPFSILDRDSFEFMLKSAGGNVVKELNDISLNNNNGVALLLAEQESTQEDKFMYISVKFNIVPVNYEWALNCLGSYELQTIRFLLLCPESLIPISKLKWPQTLIATPTSQDITLS